MAPTLSSYRVDPELRRRRGRLTLCKRFAALPDQSVGSARYAQVHFYWQKQACSTGKKATTHWGSCVDLAAKYPDIDVLNDPIFVHDGAIWTSAGVTAGIDMALALVEEDYGQALAARIARNLVVYLRRPAGQAQFSEPLSLQQRSNPGDYGGLIDLVESSLNRSWTIDELAKKSGQSSRTFQRRFTETVGQSPAAAIELLRVSRARLMLETTSAPPAVVASRCGFGSQEQMRRAFHRQLGVTPGWIREHFGKSG